jgi:segregation and condensation protein B
MSDSVSPDVDLPQEPDAAHEVDAPQATMLPMDPTQLRRSVEAILFLADEPVDVATLADAVEQAPEVVERALEELAELHVSEQRGTEIRAVAGGWRMYSSPAAKPAVERWALAGRTGRLTQAALETLAVIAYKQPIGRQEIGDIRGVNADGAVRNLVARGLVEEVGRDPGPGQAVLYGTTRLLLERLGLRSLDELPDLTDFLPEAPAPDEPDLGALKEVRRRLAAGGDLPTRGLGGRSAEQTNTGVGDDEDPDDGDTMPPPDLTARRARDDGSMEDLTDRLEQAARNAMERLRSVTDPADAEDDAEADAEGDAADEAHPEPQAASAEGDADRHDGREPEPASDQDGPGDEDDRA